MHSASIHPAYTGSKSLNVNAYSAAPNNNNNTQHPPADCLAAVSSAGCIAAACDPRLGIDTLHDRRNVSSALPTIPHCILTPYNSCHASLTTLAKSQQLPSVIFAAFPPHLPTLIFAALNVSKSGRFYTLREAKMTAEFLEWNEKCKHPDTVVSGGTKCKFYAKGLMRCWSVWRSIDLAQAVCMLYWLWYTSKFIAEVSNSTTSVDWVTHGGRLIRTAAASVVVVVVSR